jgi:uncharacterized membrane protein YoaK (UPF0700 family)
MTGSPVPGKKKEWPWWFWLFVIFFPIPIGLGPGWVAVIFAVVFAIFVWVIIQDFKNNSSA